MLETVISDRPIQLCYKRDMRELPLSVSMKYLGQDIHEC